ncbi:MAG: hypothetical protein ACOC1K_06555, partial [Nanoarchaeota archaeon]
MIISTMPLFLIFQDILVINGNINTPIIRAIVLITAILFLSLKKGNRVIRNFSLLLFLTYIAIIILSHTNFGSNDIILGIDIFLRMLITLMFFPISLVYINSHEKFKTFLKYASYG